MKRKLTVLMALVLIVAMFSTSVMAGSSWLYYESQSPWDNGYRVSKATEYWYGDDVASEDPLEKVVYEYTYNDLGYEIMMTETTTDLRTGEVYKYISRNEYDNDGDLVKYWDSELLPGETEEEIYRSAVIERDAKDRTIKRYYYDGEIAAENLDTVYTYEYWGDTRRETKRTEYWGTEQKLAFVTTYEYNDDGQCVKNVEENHTGDTPVKETTTYEYNEKGYLVKQTSGDKVYTFTLDNEGRIIKSVYTVAGVEQYNETSEYDANGNCTKMVYTDSEGYTDVNEYTYNERNQELTYKYNGDLCTQRFYYGSGKLQTVDNVMWGQTYDYKYDNNGNNNYLSLHCLDIETEEPFMSAEVTIEYEADPSYNWFTDVTVGGWDYAGIVWAAMNGVTTGTGDGDTFSPTDECTRGQVVTFLYRAAGEPEVTTTECPFVDVDVEEYYGPAVLWAAENGVTTGIDATHFNPNGKVSRAEFVTFLYRAAKGTASDAENTFKDVADGIWYEDEVIWAAQNEITAGKGSADTFAPTDICTRAETVTFLYRYYG